MAENNPMFREQRLYAGAGDKVAATETFKKAHSIHIPVMMGSSLPNIENFAKAARE